MTFNIKSVKTDKFEDIDANLVGSGNLNHYDEGNYGAMLLYRVGQCPGNSFMDVHFNLLNLGLCSTYSSSILNFF